MGRRNADKKTNSGHSFFWRWLQQHYLYRPIVFHVINFFLVLLVLYIVYLFTLSQPFPELYQGCIFVSFVIFYLVPLYLRRYGQQDLRDREELNVTAYRNLYLWVWSIGAVGCLFRLPFGQAKFTTQFLLRLPEFFQVLFITILVFFVSRILHRQESISKANENILNTLETKIGPKLTEFKRASGKLDQSIKQMSQRELDVIKTMRLYGDVVGLQEALGPASKCLTFLDSWQTNLGGIVEVVKHYRSQADQGQCHPAVCISLSVLFKTYLENDFEKLETNRISFNTTFSHYANAVKELVKTFEEENKQITQIDDRYSFYTLLASSPKGFFNLKGFYSDPVWLDYLDFNLSIVKTSRFFKFLRYFLTVDCARVIERNVTADPIFEREKDHYILCHQSKVPKRLDKESVLALLSDTRRDIDRREYDTNMILGSQAYLVVPTIEYINLEGDDQFVGLSEAMLCYHQPQSALKRVFNLDEYQQAISRKLPFELFTIRKDNDWLLALGAEMIGDIDHMQLDIHLPGMGSWRNTKQHLDNVFLSTRTDAITSLV